MHITPAWMKPARVCLTISTSQTTSTPAIAASFYLPKKWLRQLRKLFLKKPILLKPNHLQIKLFRVGYNSVHFMNKEFCHQQNCRLLRKGCQAPPEGAYYYHLISSVNCRHRTCPD